MVKKYVCACGIENEAGKECQSCLDLIKNNPIEKMTLEQRIKELKRWTDNCLSINMSKLHKRIEELMQRPVWTHELANPKLLIKELENNTKANLKDVIDKIPDHLKKKTIIVGNV